MPSTGAKSNTLLTCLVLILFFVSGFAALLYQIVWQRMLALFSGVDTYSLTITVAAFMTGLGFGNLIGGHIADRIPARHTILMFAISEAAVAFFAFISKALIYDLLYFQHGDLAGSLSTLALVLFCVLLWPTFFMGLSLPLLSRCLSTELDKAPKMIAALYGINTIGAAFGALLTGWYLIRFYGFERAIQVGFTLNLLCGLLAVVLFMHSHKFNLPLTDDQSMPKVSLKAAPLLSQSTQPILFRFSTWLVIYAASGFLALSLEIVWFRLLEILMKPTAFTFANLLFIYLLSFGIGTVLGTALSAKTPQPTRLFLFMQSGITLYSGISIAVLSFLLGKTAVLKRTWQQLLGLDGKDAIPQAVGSATQTLPGLESHSIELIRLTSDLGIFYFILPILLIGPPTFMMGFSFPALQKIVQKDLTFIGRRVGWLQTANILGCIAGTILTSVLFMHFLGTPTTIRALIGIGSIFSFIWVFTARFRNGSQRIAGLFAVGTLFTLGIWVIPAASTLWTRLHRASTEDLIHAEDASGLCVLKETAEGKTHMFINGISHSWLPYGTVHTVLGMLPAMIHDNPEEVAVIGLGSGETAYAIGSRQGIQEITCFEIVKPVIETLNLLNQTERYPGLKSLLQDKRVNFILSDGRAFTLHNEKKYDIIEADALPSFSAFSGNLYSYEYFMLLRNRLKPGGLAVTWAPTRRVLDTFLKAFPFVLVLKESAVLIGSEKPLLYDPRTIKERLENSFTKAYFEKGAIDVHVFAILFSSSTIETFSEDHDRSKILDINTDLFPKDEYLVPPVRRTQQLLKGP